MADDHLANHESQESTTKEVFDVALSLREKLVEVNWSDEELRRVIRSQTGQLAWKIVFLPLLPAEGRFSLEHKLARAEAERVYAWCSTLEDALSAESPRGSTLTEDGIRRLNHASRHFSAALGAFVAIAHGL